MRNTGKCPKCGSGSILTVRSDMERRTEYTSYPYIPTGKFLATQYGEGVAVTRYVCRTCGYVEQWVDPEELERSGAAAYWANRAQEEMRAELERNALLRQREAERERLRQQDAQRRQAQEREEALLGKRKDKKRKVDPWD